MPCGGNGGLDSLFCFLPVPGSSTVSSGPAGCHLLQIHCLYSSQQPCRERAPVDSSDQVMAGELCWPETQARPQSPRSCWAFEACRRKEKGVVFRVFSGFTPQAGADSVSTITLCF